MLYVGTPLLPTADLFAFMLGIKTAAPLLFLTNDPVTHLYKQPIKPSVPFMCSMEQAGLSVCTHCADCPLELLLGIISIPAMVRAAV